MEIKTLELGLIRVNCYLIKTEKTALVIDPGFCSCEIEDFLLENRDKERLILLTHAHFDHIGWAEELRNRTGVKIAIGENDNADLSNTRRNMSDRFHAKLTPFSADILLKDEQVLNIGDIKIEVIYTPGHTIGGVSYKIGDNLFSGDTLFYESIGRTDFYDGDYETILNSIKRLFLLEDETVVYSGHGPKTTIGHEKKYNPFIH